MGDLSGVKAGDTLLIAGRWNSNSLATVDRVTPTGRVILKNGEQFNPNGYRRGDTGFHRTWARLATEDDIAGVNRHAIAGKLSRFQWDKLGADDLKTVGQIVSKYEQQHR